MHPGHRASMVGVKDAMEAQLPYYKLTPNAVFGIKTCAENALETIWTKGSEIGFNTLAKLTNYMQGTLKYY